MCKANLAECHKYLEETVGKSASPAIAKAISDVWEMIGNSTISATDTHAIIDREIKWPLLKNFLDQWKINFIEGDITKQTTDALVNAANSEGKVLGMWWVAWAMGKEWWQQLEDACQDISQEKKMQKGKVFTTDSRRKGQKILHAVTMDLWGKVSTDTVRKATRNMIIEAKKQWCKSITLPLFGSWVGWLSSEQSKIAIQKWLYDMIWHLDYFSTINIIDYKPHTVSFDTTTPTMQMTT